MPLHEEPALFAQPELESAAHGSFAATPFRPRTRPSQASVRKKQNQEEELLLANQKRRGERQPTADRLELTTTFPNAQPGTALTTDRCTAPPPRLPATTPSVRAPRCADPPALRARSRQPVSPARPNRE